MQFGRTLQVHDPSFYAANWTGSPVVQTALLWSDLPSNANFAGTPAVIQHDHVLLPHQLRQVVVKPSRPLQEWSVDPEVTLVQNIASNNKCDLKFVGVFRELNNHGHSQCKRNAHYANRSGEREREKEKSEDSGQ